MMLFVLDKDYLKSAELLPDSIKHKALLELMQMLSCIVGFGYEKIPQGKKIKEWISKNKRWVYYYANELYNYLDCKQSLKKTTKIKYRCLIDLLWCECENEKYHEPTTGIFRYIKDYNNTTYATDTELPIEDCIFEYKKYLEWKDWK